MKIAIWTLLLAMICEVLSDAREGQIFNLSSADGINGNVTESFDQESNYVSSKMENFTESYDFTYFENSTDMGQGSNLNRTSNNNFDNNSPVQTINEHDDVVEIIPTNYSSAKDSFLDDENPPIFEKDLNPTNRKPNHSIVRPWQSESANNFANSEHAHVHGSATRSNITSTKVTHKDGIGTPKVSPVVDKLIHHSETLHNVRYIVPNKLKRQSYSYNVDLRYTIAPSTHSPPDVRPNRNYSNAFTYITSTVETVIDDKSPTNVTIQLGSTAYLPCKIKNLGNKTVSWIRNRDSHILTVDRYIFIADERFQAWHDKKSGTWTLMVKYVQERDDGRYECQVSSAPKISHFVYFNVVSPRVRITGGSDIYVKVGTSITLTCIISNVLKQPEYVFWYQNNRRVISRGDKTAGKLLEDDVNSTTISTLDIPHAGVHDAGIYHCSPERLNPAKVTLHVINGEHPAAMQHGTSVMTSATSPRLLVLALMLQIIPDLIQ